MEKLNFNSESLLDNKTFLDKDKIHEFGISERGESIHDIFDRVSLTISQVESKFSNPGEITDFRENIMVLLKNQKFIPSTTILMNAGRFNEAPLSACAIPPINLQKDLKEIKRSVDKFHFSGMGTGFNFDDLEDPIKIIEYLNRIGIDGQNNEKQLRPVGNMGTLSIDHPKILEFIKLKTNEKDKQWVFNFSVNISDVVLERIKSNKPIILKNGDKISAEKLLDTIAESIYYTGDPGIVFIDRINKDNQVPKAGEYESLAPCGEVGLSKGETCAFSYLNLGKFVKNGEIDYQDLEKTIILVTRFLDDVVEYNISKFSNEASKDITKKKNWFRCMWFCRSIKKIKNRL